MRQKVNPGLPAPEVNPFDEAERLASDDPMTEAAFGPKGDPRRPYQGGPGAPVHGVRQITVTWGEQVIQPIQYNGFRVGPLTMTADVLPSETPREAYARVWRILDDLAQQQFSEQVQSFIRNVKAAGQAVRSRASGS